MSKNINDLRDAMFEALQDLRVGKIDIAQAKAISNIGHVIVNSAKVEVEYMKATGCPMDGSFILPHDASSTPTGIKLVKQNALPNGITGITTHVMKG